MQLGQQGWEVSLFHLFLASPLEVVLGLDQAILVRKFFGGGADVGEDLGVALLPPAGAPGGVVAAAHRGASRC